MTHLTKLGDEEIISDVVGGNILLLLGKLEETLTSTYLDKENLSITKLND